MTILRSFLNQIFSQTTSPFSDPVTICDLCHHHQFTKIKTIKDPEWQPVLHYYQAHPEPNPFQKLPSKFQLIQCKACGLVAVSPRIQEAVVNRFYNEYLGGKYQGYLHTYDQKFREEIFRQYLTDLTPYLPSKYPGQVAILDLGCASGQLLKLFQQQGYQTYGIEVAPQIAKIAKKYGQILVGDVIQHLTQLKDKTFDLITSIDSMEHFSSPNQVIRVAAKKLKPHGYLFIETPNFHSGLDEMSRHFHLFTPDTLSKLVTMHGLKVKVVTTTDIQYNPHDPKKKPKQVNNANSRFVRILAQR